MRRDFFYLLVYGFYIKKQVGRSEQNFKKHTEYKWEPNLIISIKFLNVNFKNAKNMANLHIDCHNDNMSQQYSESKGAFL
jgi:hypothetical protein